MKTDQSNSFDKDLDRREFLSTVTKVMGSTVLLSTPFTGHASMKTDGNQTWTVGQIMDLFIREVPGAPFPNTVDTLKSGNRDIKVTGIVTTMFATLDVIQKAIAMNANFIIAHEPTFYNHTDDTSWLQDDPVYRFKSDLLKKHNIAVWRNHDYVHSLTTDGVRAGVTSKLKWERFINPSNPSVFEMPAQSLRSLIAHVKQNLGVPMLRYIGDLSQSCKRILLMPGASGGRSHLTAIAREKPDVIVCGEIAEWETAEYVRDAMTKGDNLSLVVIGHVASEEPGSAFLASWFQSKVNGITTTHIPAENSLSFL